MNDILLFIGAYFLVGFVLFSLYAYFEVDIEDTIYNANDPVTLLVFVLWPVFIIIGPIMLIEWLLIKWFTILTKLTKRNK